MYNKLVFANIQIFFCFHCSRISSLDYNAADYPLKRQLRDLRYELNDVTEFKQIFRWSTNNGIDNGTQYKHQCKVNNTTIHRLLTLKMYEAICKSGEVNHTYEYSHQWKSHLDINQFCGYFLPRVKLMHINTSIFFCIYCI